MVPPEFVSFALTLADAARRETLRRVGLPVPVENKGLGREFDPVTEADRVAERTMRNLIAQTFPDHGVSGEEFGHRAGGSAYQWSLDPIDGTRSYICGLPSWTTLIGLLEHGRPVLGIIDAPQLDERFVGFAAGGWWRLGDAEVALGASGCTQLGAARLATTDPFLFEGDVARAFGALRAAVRTTRYGYDAYAYARLAAGTLDLVVENALKPHDYQALIPVVRGAGGHFGDWRGGTDFGAGEVIAAATPELYAAAVAIMGGAAR